MTCRCIPKRYEHSVGTARIHAEDARRALDAGKPFSAMGSAMTAARFLAQAEEAANLGCQSSPAASAERRLVADMLSDLARDAAYFHHARERR